MSEQQQRYGADVDITDEQAERLLEAGFEVLAGVRGVSTQHVRCSASSVEEAQRRLSDALGAPDPVQWRQVYA